ncbi:MAG: hypothetical protein HF300_00445 [Ignavibacteria bacterium]|jgi:hypothetical protein|nr:hypothetical protein [Ignavibacteria bacterium]MCU7510992.1 hypothetical protein [Ignavibacteria bacterium]MCU7518846.1 hypothetical protein [Ignavibacteria bacterium]
MKTLESYRLNRYDSIARVLTENRAVVAHSRELSFSTSKLCKIIEDIRRKQKEFSLQLQSGHQRVLKLKDELTMILSAVAMALSALGKETENTELMNASKISRKELFSMNDDLLIAKALSIYNLAERYCRELKEYNISRNSLQFLKSRTGEFRYALNENWAKHCFLNYSVIKLDELFMQADEVLENIDGFVEVLSTSYSEFSRDYLNIRYTSNN